MINENCGFLHYRTDPCRVDKKSTAAKKVSPRHASSVKDDTQPRARLGSGMRGEAGTQALPVDTNPDQPLVALAVTGHGLAFTSSAGTDEDKDRQPNPVVAKRSATQFVHKLHILKKHRGRPSIHPDRKAYKAQHERDRRARKKEGN